MGCLLALFAWVSPRFALVIVYLFTNRLTIAFHSGWTGIIGFFVLPYTTLFYALVYQPGRGVQHFGWVVVAFGVLFDLFSLGFGRRAQKRRNRHQPQPS
jgi:hypothetical protein